MSDLARVFLRTSTVSNIKLSDYFTHLELLTTENKRNAQLHSTQSCDGYLAPWLVAPGRARLCHRPTA